MHLQAPTIAFQHSKMAAYLNTVLCENFNIIIDRIYCLEEYYVTGFSTFSTYLTYEQTKCGNG